MRRSSPKESWSNRWVTKTVIGRQGPLWIPSSSLPLPKERERSQFLCNTPPLSVKVCQENKERTGTRTFSGDHSLGNSINFFSFRSLKSFLILIPSLFCFFLSFPSLPVPQKELAPTDRTRDLRVTLETTQNFWNPRYLTRCCRHRRSGTNRKGVLNLSVENMSTHIHLRKHS